MNKKQYRELLNSIVDECPSDHECILKQILTSAHHSVRLLVQLKNIELYKKLIENLECKGISWQEATDLWVKNGRAGKFAEVYNEDKNFREIYKEVMKDE